MDERAPVSDEHRIQPRGMSVVDKTWRASQEQQIATLSDECRIGAWLLVSQLRVESSSG